MKKLITILLIVSAAASFAEDGTSLSGTLFVYPRWDYTKTSGAAVVTATFPNKLVEQAISNGTNANQMTHLVAESWTLTNNETRTVSLIAATNAFGDEVSFSRINFMAVKVSTNASGAITITGSSSNGAILWHDEAVEVSVVQPGGTLTFTAPDAEGIPVATNTCDFDVYNSGTNSAGVEIYVGGVAE